MHHSEIGRIIEVFQDIHFLSESKTLITIESHWCPNPWNQGQRDHMGLCITAPLAKTGRIDIGINAFEEDSRFISIHYYKDKLDSSPTASFYQRDHSFCLNSLRSFIKLIALVDKGLKDISCWENNDVLIAEYGIYKSLESDDRTDDFDLITHLKKMLKDQSMTQV